jgi:anti-sigma B factor antagonist
MPKRELKIETDYQDGIAIVTLHGGVDASNSEDFKRTLDPLCKDNSTSVILDCSNLSYVSSTSLGLLFHYHRACEASQHQLVLCAVWEKIHNIIRLLGLDSVLKICGSREEALEYLASCTP